ncbi:MAG: hypothetical protein BJ554DRAFT_6528, partial [Olpidium bornovanus]
LFALWYKAEKEKKKQQSTWALWALPELKKRGNGNCLDFLLPPAAPTSTIQNLRRRPNVREAAGERGTEGITNVAGRRRSSPREKVTGPACDVRLEQETRRPRARASPRDKAGVRPPGDRRAPDQPPRVRGGAPVRARFGGAGGRRQVCAPVLAPAPPAGKRAQQVRHGADGPAERAEADEHLARQRAHRVQEFLPFASRPRLAGREVGRRRSERQPKRVRVAPREFPDADLEAFAAGRTRTPRAEETGAETPPQKVKVGFPANEHDGRADAHAKLPRVPVAGKQHIHGLFVGAFGCDVVIESYHVEVGKAGVPHSVVGRVQRGLPLQ